MVLDDRNIGKLYDMADLLMQHQSTNFDAEYFSRTLGVTQDESKAYINYLIELEVASIAPEYSEKDLHIRMNHLTKKFRAIGGNPKREAVG